MVVIDESEAKCFAVCRRKAIAQSNTEESKPDLIIQGVPKKWCDAVSSTWNIAPFILGHRVVINIYE